MFRPSPAAAAVAQIAFVVSVAKWLGRDASPLYMSEAWMTEPWRLVTSVFPHADPFHLLFNLYWLFVLGKRVEDELGLGKTLGFYLFLCVSSAAEFAFLDGGIGLSGVVYGLFGYLWAKGELDKRTIYTFVGWFFLCIVMTVTNVMSVANIAHGVGAILGVLAGSSRRLPAIVAAVAFLVAAGPGRAYVNVSGHRANDLAYSAWKDIEAKRFELAVTKLEEAVKVDPKEASYWYNLAYAYQGLNKMDDVLRVSTKLHEVSPTAEHKRILARTYYLFGYKKAEAGDTAASLPFYKDAMRLFEEADKIGTPTEMDKEETAAVRAWLDANGGGLPPLPSPAP